MEFAVIPAVLFGLAAAVLAVRLFLVRRAVRHLARDMTEKLSGDTNTPLTVDVRDAAVRELASGLNRELSALRAERLRLQNGDREVREAITDISHDLRTPLTAIHGYLDLLDGEEKSETVGRYLGVIRERTDALNALAEELFRYSVIVSTADDLKPETVDLRAALQVSLAGFWGALTGRGICPEVRICDTPVLRQLDPQALGRIFGNILNNAVKYSDGDLTVTLTEDGTVQISNSARSLTPLDAARLFNRFYTVESARNSTGLGLSITRLLTERSGGTVTADCPDGRLTVTLKF